MLLKKGADVNARGNTGWTALMIAVDLSHMDTARALLQKGADVNARDKDGNTALRLAEKYKYAGLIALLKTPPGVPQTKSVKDSPKSKPVEPPATAAPPSVSKPQPPTLASKVGPDLNKKLLDAAEAGDTSEVQSLLTEGADANSKGSYGHTALMSAAVRGHTDTVRTLLKAGADVNAKGSTGRTALMEAASAGYTDTMRTLIEKGADVNAKDNEGWTALFWATYSRRTDTVRFLLEKGADANARNKYDDTALIRAAYGGDTDTVALLLEKGADLNAKDDLGRTGLIEAARQNHPDTVRALLERGSDVHLLDRDGGTALSEAEKHNYSEVIALLKNPPAKPEGKITESTTTAMPDVPPASTAPNSAPATTGVQALEKKSHAQAFFRLGLNMQQMEDLWPQAGSLAASWASGIQQDLMKVGAPGNLIELAHQAYISLSASPKGQNGLLVHLIHDLRARLDGFCEAQREEKFFYTAGGFTYNLTVLGEDLENPSTIEASVEDNRRKTLLVADALAAQCSTAESCKDRALSHFLAAAVLLKKSQPIPADGPALQKISGDLELALSGDAH
jgi:ankyrin repeat protein